MKNFISLLAMSAVVFLSAAQTKSQNTDVIRGAVIDKNGNPLPGAVITATGGAETTLAESDGSFVMEVPVWLKSVTASYAGYKSKKKKPTFNTPMLFRLSPKSPRYGFLNACYGYNISDVFPQQSNMAGITGGLLGCWGVYGKVMVPVSNYRATIKGVQAIIGLVKRIYRDFYFLVGVGYGGYLYRDKHYYYHYGEYLYEDCKWVGGLVYDFSFLIGLGRHLDLSLGATVFSDGTSKVGACPNISFGYKF